MRRKDSKRKGAFNPFTCARTCTYAHARTYSTHAHTYVHAHTHTFAHTHARTQTHIRARTQTHIHAHNKYTGLLA